MARIKLSLEPDYEDYLAVSKAATFNKPTLILMGIMVLSTIITGIGILVGRLNLDSNRLLLTIIPPGMFIIFLIAAPINLRRKAKKLAAEKHIITWRVTNPGISVDEKGENQKYIWEAFGLAQELSEHFILFFKANRSKYIFMPKRIFANAAEEKEFRDLLEINQIKLI
jgi:hypothetical protein